MCRSTSKDDTVDIRHSQAVDITHAELAPVSAGAA
jgi:hypothetical protein